MNRAETKRKLKDLIENGLSIEIHRATQACLLLERIESNASVIQKLEYGSFTELFFSIEMALQTEAILALARLYDKKSNTYPTRCIYQLLYLIENESHNLPTIRKKHLKEIKLQLQGINIIDEQITDLLYEDQKKFAVELAKYFRSSLEKRSIRKTIQKLKDVRDKRFAHNEKICKLSNPSYNGLQDLLDNAKKIVGAIGHLYLDSAYINNGKYLLDFEVENLSAAMQFLIEKLILTNKD